MKKNELTYIIQQLVAEEIRKQLPGALTEVLTNFRGKKSMVTEKVVHKPNTTVEEDFRASLREMFDGDGEIINERVAPQHPRQAKTFTKNPIFNNILNETLPFSSQQRTGAAGGMAAMMDAQRAAAAQHSSPIMIDESSPSYTYGMPDMGSLMNPTGQEISTSMIDSKIPMGNLGENISVMDVKQHVPLVVQQALTKNYSKMMQLIDKKRGKI
jgi:hypothetical protein